MAEISQSPVVRDETITGRIVVALRREFATFIRYVAKPFCRPAA